MVNGQNILRLNNIVTIIKNDDVVGALLWISALDLTKKRMKGKSQEQTWFLGFFKNFNELSMLPWSVPKFNPPAAMQSSKKAYNFPVLVYILHVLDMEGLICHKKYSRPKASMTGDPFFQR